MTDEPLLLLDQVRKIYRTGAEEVHALDGISLSVAPGEYVAIIGASGSGKSTLLHILGLLDRPTDGRYLYRGRTINDRSDRELAQIRNREIGFVFQGFNLLSTASAAENVMLPLIYGPPALGKRERVRVALEKVGMGHRLHHRPTQLSGGEQQRVAIARALVKNPPLMLADEPTGNLDSKNTEEVIGLLEQLHQGGLTVVLITHENDVAERAQRIVRLSDGRVVTDRPTARAAAGGGT